MLAARDLLQFRLKKYSPAVSKEPHGKPGTSTMRSMVSKEPVFLLQRNLLPCRQLPESLLGHTK